MMAKSFITTSSAQTKKLGEMLAQEFCGGEIICLSGELGTGKTTFTQGLLKGSKIKGPHTSPTFNIIKNYKTKLYNLRTRNYELKTILHVDAYRVKAADILNLGWKDFAGRIDSVVIIEWADRIKKIIPNPPAGGALWINFEWLDKNKRKLTLKNSR